MYSILVTGKIQLPNKNSVIIEIPYVHYHMDAYTISYGSYYTYAQPAYNSGNIGNLYFAYEFTGDDEHLSTTVGISLPTASDKEAAPVVGGLYDYDQFALYDPYHIALRPQINYSMESNDLFAKISGSPTITCLTKENTGMSTIDLVLCLSLYGGLKVGDFSAAIGWAGNFVATESGQFSDRFFDQTGIIVGYQLAHFHPELFYRVPVSDNLSFVLKSVIGLSARYEF